MSGGAQGEINTLQTTAQYSSRQINAMRRPFVALYCLLAFLFHTLDHLFAPSRLLSRLEQRLHCERHDVKNPEMVGMSETTFHDAMRFIVNEHSVPSSYSPSLVFSPLYCVRFLSCSDYESSDIAPNSAIVAENLFFLPCASNPPRYPSLNRSHTAMSYHEAIVHAFIQSWLFALSAGSHGTVGLSGHARYVRMMPKLR
jgi:hypothetical protein